MGAPPLSPSPKARAALSRDLGDFLIELSIALHKHAMYPADHPSLLPAAKAVGHRAALLLADRATLALGVARHQLVIEGIATDPKHPVLRELADRLHRHHLGAVTFSEGVTVEEIAELMRVLAVEADRTGQPLGLRQADALPRWPHLRLHPLTYERLELVQDEGTAPGESQSAMARARGAQLWVGLARVALAAEGQDAPPSMEPAVIAKAIDAHSTQTAAAAYDQAIVGYLLQIAQELKSAGSAEGAALRRRMSRLVRGMKPETLRRLVEMGGDLSQRRQFVADAVEGMAVDSVVEIVQAAADTSHQTISHSLVRLFSKLAAHAEAGTAEARPQAEAALRQQVRRLLDGWTLTDPNPGAYGAALQRMASAPPMFAAPAEEAHPTEPDRLARMGLELETAATPVLEAADRMVEDGRVLELVDLLEQMPPTSETSRRFWSRLATVDVVSQLAVQETVDFKALERIAARAGPAAAEPLLDALALAESRGARRGLIGLLAGLGPRIGPLIVNRLNDERWFVVRNLLMVLEEIGEVPAGFSAGSLTGHRDSRVRWQALKLQLGIPGEHDAALETGLADSDERVVRLALTAAQQFCPEAIVPAVAHRAMDPAMSSDVRVLAIRVLGTAGTPLARDTLVQMTSGGRSFLGVEKLARKSPELLAALGALAASWREDPEARRAIERAASSRDPEIRAAVTAGARR